MTTLAVAETVWPIQRVMGAFQDADQSVNNSTTPVSSDYLKLYLLPGQRWYFNAMLLYNSSTVADFKVVWSTPSGASGKWSGLYTASGVASSGPVTVDLTSAVTTGGNGSASPANLRVEGYLEAGTTAGIAVIQFAQNTAEVSDTFLRKGSVLHLRRG